MHLICTFFAYIDTSSIDNSMKYLTHLVIDESNPVQSCCNTSFCLWQSAIAKLFDVGHSMPNQHTIKSVSTDFVQISFTSWISCYFTSAQISDRSAKWCGRYGCISFGRVQRIESGRMYTIGYIFHIFQHVGMNSVSMERWIRYRPVPTHINLIASLEYKESCPVFCVLCVSLYHYVWIIEFNSVNPFLCCLRPPLTFTPHPWPTYWHDA